MALRIALSLCLFASGVVGLPLVWIHVREFDEVLQSIDPTVKACTKILDRHDRLLTCRGALHGTWVYLESLPKYVPQAFVAAEDKDFFSHRGVSPKSIARAIVTNFRAKRMAEGGSTITQQVARLLLLNRQKSLTRKGRELFYALLLESRYSKTEILEIYLNRIYFGNQAYGIDSAARRYFNKTASELNPGEAALLAGLPQAPSRYAPHKHPDKARMRQAYVLRRMEEDGLIDSKVRATELRSGPTQSTVDLSDFGHISDVILGTVTKQFGVEAVAHKGMRVSTTLDLDLQKSASALLRGWRQQRSASLPKAEAAMLVVGMNDGGVLAYCGSLDYKQSAFNRIHGTRRSIGSQIIPMVAALALNNGLDLSSSTDPTMPGSPSILDALNKQDPYLAAPIVGLLGLGTTIDFMRRLGLTPITADMSLILGRDPFTPWQLAQAWTALLDVPSDAHLLAAIKDSKGTIIFERAKMTKAPPLSPQAAFILSYALENRLATAGISSWIAVDPGLRDLWILLAGRGQLTILWHGIDSGPGRLAPSRAQAEVIGEALAKDIILALYPRSTIRTALPAGVHFKVLPKNMDSAMRPVPFVRR